MRAMVAIAESVFGVLAIVKGGREGERGRERNW
jgi:hypothetical protein